MEFSSNTGDSNRFILEWLHVDRKVYHGYLNIKTRFGINARSSLLNESHMVSTKTIPWPCLNLYKTAVSLWTTQ